MRIGGLASGMDIDTIVGDLMKAERMPLDKLTQKKQTLEWKRDNYRDMNKLLANLDTFIFDGVFRQGTYTKKTVISSKENEVTVKNINATSNLTSTIKVNKLAESAYMNGADDIRNNTAFDPNGKLSDQRVNFKTDFTSNEITIQAVKSDGTMPTIPVKITIDPTNDSLNSVIDKINNSDAGVIAFFDSQTGKASLSAKNTGDVTGSAEIIVTGDFLTASLKLDSNNIDAKNASRGREGQNADFVINGLSTSRSSNTFQINGFEYTLKEASGTDIAISSSTDVDSIFNSVKSFVDKYNEVIAKINGELTEERYRSYQPLTDEEKEAMSEKQIELWEEKAKSGLLRNDPILSSALNKMRLDMYSRVGNDSDDVNNDYDQLSEIGIKTSSNYLERGKLVIDEDKLKEAISKDPNAIYKLFTNDSTTFESKGIARRLRDTIKETIGKVEQRAGKTTWTNQQFTIGKDLNNVDKQINSFEDRLKRIEDRYWRQFTAMEKAIQQSNSQSMYLMQQFGM